MKSETVTPLNALDGYYLGACECGRPADCYQNVPHQDGAAHWAVCKECCTRWLLGVNLFTGWQHDLDEKGPEAWRVWEAQAAGLLPVPFRDEYREVSGRLPSWIMEAFRRENERAVQRREAR